MYQSLTDQVKHFNSLQSTYRSFASAWILAAFAGIASTTTKPDIAQWICMLSIGGMVMFLALDLGYHILLKAVLEVQRAMENENRYSWIPKAAGGMDGAFKGSFGTRIWAYYLIAIAIFLAAFLKIQFL